jgi:HEAT repeat protein
MTLADRLRSAALDQRQAAIASVAAGAGVDADALDALAECLGHDRKAIQRPAADAFAALAARGAPVRDRLLRVVETGAPRQRWGAVYALARLGPLPPLALPVLLDGLGSADGDVRWATAELLQRLPEQEVLVARLRALTADGNAAQRKMALYCLRDLGARTPDVERAVSAALADGNRDVRLAAIATLARIASARAVAADRLLAMLADDDVGVRRAAAAALGTLGEATPAVCRALEIAAAGEDAALRRAAEGALRALGRPRPG